MSLSASTAAAEKLSKTKLDGLRGDVDARLDELFREDRGPARLMCAIRHGLLSPGKRLRPLITLLACEQIGGDPRRAIDAACAVEMVHAASLIIDDLPAMDNARLRRGCLANHVVFGEGSSILAAISLLNEAYRCLASIEGMPDARRTRAVASLTAAVGVDGLAGGQERDIACGYATSPTQTLADMERRHTEKTGALFIAAAEIGAEVAEADAAALAAMRDFGSALGLAYQTFDDVLDCSATPDEAGKDTGQDEGKSTVVSILGRDGARQAGARWLGRAVDAAESAAPNGAAPLADLARLIGAKFCVAPA
ncbi:MAG: polyprenyl synthetase family protein [Parvularculaceae bacterium]